MLLIAREILILYKQIAPFCHEFYYFFEQPNTLLLKFVLTLSIYEQSSNPESTTFF